MEKRIYPQAIESVVMPEPFGRKSFDDARKAVAVLEALYDRNTKFLRDSFAKLAAGGDESKRYRAFYPQIGVTTTSFTQIDSRQAYDHMPTPGHFATTITQPSAVSGLPSQLRLGKPKAPVTCSRSPYCGVKKKSQMFATAIIGSTVGVKNAMRSHVRPRIAEFTHSAMRSGKTTRRK